MGIGEIEGKPISLWKCTACGIEGIGTVYPLYDIYIGTSLECDEPEGWWVSTKEALCRECKPK